MFESIALTPEDEKKWESTSSMFMWTTPGFNYLWSNMIATRHKREGTKYLPVFTEETDVACTDGVNVYFNPKTFFKYSLNNRVFICGHEVLHVVFDDVRYLNQCKQQGYVLCAKGEKLPLDEDVMQRAMDKRNNLILVNSKIGTMPADAVFDKAVTEQDSVSEIYAKDYKKKMQDQNGASKPQPGQQPGQQPAGQQPGTDNGKPGFDKVVAPGAGGDKSQADALQRDDQKWQVEVAQAAALENIKRQGKMPGAMKRLFENITDPEIHWLDHIKTLVKRKTGSGSYQWLEPDPWWSALEVYSPRPTGTNAGWIAVWGDTSGSRSNVEVQSNINEVGGVLDDVMPDRLTVLWCDARIEYVDELTDISDLEKVQARGVKGGGGTSMKPVMEWIASQHEQPEVLLAFTDGHVTFPDEPDFPVIWVSSTDVKYPYGDVVRVLDNKK